MFSIPAPVVVAEQISAPTEKQPAGESATLFLRGVVMAKPPAALISIDDQPEGVYKVGEQVVPGITIRKIEARRIMLQTPRGELRLPLRGRQTIDVSHLPAITPPPTVELAPVRTGHANPMAGTEAYSIPPPPPTYDGRTERERRLAEEAAKPERERASVDPTPPDKMPRPVNPRRTPPPTTTPIQQELIQLPDQNEQNQPPS